ncbi:Hypothetical protein I596_1286 [Dokdonella koreensis DS-123]|uniref:Uncharacterized protein n=1 Tax=Dokdonella koreensis DS-123 TaxID=1300342 RepID=A0A167GRT0_9GAMM|nr:Hypothetical protein I596_1286 [Dokdonella koreensis DS-123]
MRPGRACPAGGLATRRLLREMTIGRERPGALGVPLRRAGPAVNGAMA